MASHSSAALLPKPGELVDGRFRVERTLGVGGMGGVLAVVDLRTGARVALKLMLPHLAENAEFLERFAREATSASVLVTPHVARVFEAGHTSDGSPFMVMELLEGRDLDQTLRARGPLPIAEAVGYLLEACHAVAEAHARGIVHRDLKPANFFLANVGRPAPILKVLDFGISKSTALAGGGGPGDALTATETTLGSPHYMSPEQIRSAKRVDARSDLWSLGVILHKLLTGKLAFAAESVGAHMIRVVNDPPTGLRESRPDAPIELERVILRCLQKDAALRYQNVGQLALALAPFADASRGPLVAAIVATVGPAATAPPPKDAVLEPDAPTVAIREPSVRMPTPDAGTAPGWANSPPPPRRGMVVGAAVLALAVGGLGALALWRRASPPVATTPATSSIAAAAEAPPGSAVPAATASASSAPSSAPSAAPASDAVTVEAEPADAEIEVDGVIAAARPVLLPRRDTAYRVVVRAPGYVPETRAVGKDVSGKVHVALRKADHVEKKKPNKVLLETNL